MRIEVVDGREQRYAVVFAHDWDTPRFRLLSPTQRCVYVTLATFAGRFTDECYPSEEKIARIVGIRRESVSRAITRLTELGYLSVEAEQRGHRRSNRYTLLTPSPAPPPPVIL